MYSPQAVMQVLDLLNESGSPYLVTGSLASNVYSTPRSTLDADFVVEMDPNELERFFSGLNHGFERESQMAFETVTGKLQHRFRHRQTNFLVEIFEARMDDPHERSRFERRRSGDVEGRIGFVPTAEDVIVQKLRWFKQIRRLKDREDVLGVLAYQWKTLDWQYLEHWCGQHETLDLLNDLKEQVKPLRHEAEPVADA